MFINPSKSRPGRKTAIGMRMWKGKASLVTASGREDCTLANFGEWTLHRFFLRRPRQGRLSCPPEPRSRRGQAYRRRRPQGMRKKRPHFWGHHFKEARVRRESQGRRCKVPFRQQNG